MIGLLAIAGAIVLALVTEIVDLRRELARERRSNESLRHEVGAWRRRDLVEHLRRAIDERRITA